VGIAARTLGWRHALDLNRLTGAVNEWSKGTVTTGGQVVAAVAALAGAAAVGLAAQAVGGAVEGVVLAADWRGWPWPARQITDRRVERRKERWWKAHREYDRTSSDETFRKWRRIALEEPDRPTWSGDRMNAVAARLRRDYQLHLATVWPYLWLTLSDVARNEIVNAEMRLRQAMTLMAWAMLYLGLTFWWWPAALIALGIAVTAHRRIRLAVDTYAQLLEAAVRLHLPTIGSAVGVTSAAFGKNQREFGKELTLRFHSWPVEPGRDGAEPSHSLEQGRAREGLGQRLAPRRADGFDE